MDEVQAFGELIAVASIAVSLALGATKVTQRIGVPAPALFLAAAAITSDLFPGLSKHVETKTVERVAVIALIVILLDGGMHVGWRKFRAAAVPIGILGVVGTFATAGAVAVVAQPLLDVSWTTAFIIGAALAPTDPAVMFSVLGNREVGGRTGTILEGESGANDPVGIALMLGVLAYATSDDGSAWTIVEEFAVEMAVGIAVGAAGAWALLWLMRHTSLPDRGLYPLRVLAFAGVIYGVAATLHGSGFLAVFIAGLLIGDERAPYKAEIESFHTSLSSLAEIAVFIALGLTIDVTEIGDEGWWLDGLLLFLALAFVVRPLVVGPLLLPARLRTGERLFVMWGGLKGAVPILLAAFAVLAEVDEAQRVYGLVFVVVLLSVLVQGSTVPRAAARFGVPMRTVEHVGTDTAAGSYRFRVASASHAAGRAVRELPLGESGWVSSIVRDGTTRNARGGDVLEAGDEVLVLVDDERVAAVRRLFEG
ncbi:MAG: cation:proton antiporter [Pseudomonadota bacterium]